MPHFWKTLKGAGKPITILAPMEEVTDVVFRTLISQLGRPDIFFTEFTSVEGINSIGQAKVIHRLRYDSTERPIVAQMWGTTPEHYKKAAELAVAMGFDGLDINMGCPVPKVIKRGACSALIKNSTLAAEIVAATKEGLAGRIPLSIKTRLGFGTIQTEEWIGFVLHKLKPEALTVHLRTVKELSEPPPHWEEMPKIIEMRNTFAPETVVIGNGSLSSMQEIREKVAMTGMDGGMVGRGIFHNPWLFSERDVGNITPRQRLETLLQHTQKFVMTWGVEKNFAVLKRFFKIYCNGFVGAKELRVRLMETSTLDEVQTIVNSFLVEEKF